MSFTLSHTIFVTNQTYSKKVYSKKLFAIQSTADKLRRCYWLSFSYFYLLFNKHFGVCMCISFSNTFSINESTPNRIFIELKNTPTIYVRVCTCLYYYFHRSHLSIYLSHAWRSGVVNTNRNKSNNTIYIHI